MNTAPHLPYRHRSRQCISSRWCAKSNFLVKCFEQKLHRRSSDEDDDDDGDDLDEDDEGDLCLLPLPPTATAAPAMDLLGRYTLSIFSMATLVCMEQE